MFQSKCGKLKSPRRKKGVEVVSKFCSLVQIADVVMLQSEEEGGMYVQQNRMTDLSLIKSTQTYSNLSETKSTD